MLTKTTSLPALENALFKFNFKKNKFIYEIARLEYKIWLALSKLETVTALIKEEEENIESLRNAIAAAGNGKVAEKLISWQTKAEFKLFKLNLRKNKINITKLIQNQSKLGQTREALIVIQKDITDVEKQILIAKVPVVVNTVANNESGRILFETWNKFLQQKDPVMTTIDQYVRGYLKIAS